tara:strand:+ start:1380 stop:1700 length:321 start_codon:yes stop_codon:yes gene_type:complete
MIELKKRKNKMKKTWYTLSLILFLSTSIYANEIKCNTTLSKLKPECNFIGKGAKKLKSISENNKTIGQSLVNAGVLKKKDNIKDKKKMTLKELNEKYKPIKLGNKK